MIRRIFSILVIISLLAVPKVQANPCLAGEGTWIKSDGTQVCKPCPFKHEYVDGFALKMPLNCMAPITGALLSISDYSNLKSTRDYAASLEKFRDNLAPSLDSLQYNLDRALEDLAVSVGKRELLVEELTIVKIQREEYRTSHRVYFWLLVGMSGLAVGLAGVQAYQVLR